MKYFAQPDYNNIQIQIYYLPPGAPAQLVTIVPLANSSIGPNDVVLYQDAGGSKMFVSYDLGGPGLVEIYDFTPILAAAVANTPIGTGTTPSPTTFTPASPTQIQPGNSVVGMAIQPGTGDLYAATFNNGNTSAQCPQLTGLGGVIVFTAASGYDPATASQFSDYHDKSVTTYSANLAFDEAGNLWMTTWDAGPGSTPDTTLAWEDQFLICYLAIGGTLSIDILQAWKYQHRGRIASYFLIERRRYPASVPSGSACAAAPLLSAGGYCIRSKRKSLGGKQQRLCGPQRSRQRNVGHDQCSLDRRYMLNYGSLQNAIQAGASGVPLNFQNDDPGVTVFYLQGAKFGGLLFDGYTLYVHDQENPPGPTEPDSVVWTFDTSVQPPTAASFFASGIVTDYPGNGGSVIVNSQPSQLRIGDTLTIRVGPLGFVELPWESPDIAVNEQTTPLELPFDSPQPIDDSFPLGSGIITHGQPAQVVVCVANPAGAPPSSGTEVLKVYWAKASAGLSWQAPWDGLGFDTTSSHPPLGGLIGAQLMDVIIPPGEESYFQFTNWSPPDSAQYRVNDQHFCVLARIETTGVYPFGFATPEETNLSGTVNPLLDNVTANPGIAWRNIAVLASVPPTGGSGGEPPPIKIGVLGARYAIGDVIKINVQTLDAEGSPLATPPKVTVRIAGPVWERLLAAHPVPEGLRHLADDLFHLHDPLLGTGAIHLERNEVLPLRFEVTPPEGVRDFAVRIVQFAESDGVEKVVGGQTFVVGKVKGFPVTRKRD
jgi:hypothetical protein